MTHILVTGVRHRTAPIEVREKFAILEEEVEHALARLKSLPGILECAILTTCNRTEIYAVVADTEEGLQSIAEFYRADKGVEISAYHRYRFTLMHEDAVMHLFRVASGMDSLILGEGQILGQVKETLTLAQKYQTIGTVLDRLFKAAISAGKRVRTETGVSEKDVSVSRAAYEFALRETPDLLNRRIALVGGGKMAEIMMALLKQAMTAEQQANVVIVNRSQARLTTLCEKYGFQGEDWSRLASVLQNTDVLFVATGAPHVVLAPEHFQQGGPKLLLDISVPRNVDPAVAELPGIRLVNTDDLAGTGGFSAETQTLIKQQAQEILEEETAAFRQWFISLPVVPVITLLHSKIEQIRQAQISELNISSLDAIEDLSRSLVKKILHDPTVRLKATGTLEEISQHAAVLSHLFNITPEADAQARVTRQSAS